MRQYEFLGYDQDGPVVTIAFDRPERMNAIGTTMSRELEPAIRTDKEAAMRGFGNPIDEGLRN